jgi:phosphatidylserine/phosphatidylglycerophosphate/cardiolipin synthase-like enzyme
MVDGFSPELSRTSSSSAPAFPFALPLKPEAQVCKPVEVEAPVCKAAQSTQPPASPDNAALTNASPSGRAQAKLNLSPVQASSELSLSVSDRNGLNRTGREDITGTLDGQVKIEKEVLHSALQGLVGLKKGDASITGMRFDAKSSSYILSLKADVFWFIEDDLELQIRTNAQGQLYLQVNENWTPNSSVISRVSNALQGMLKDKINGQQDVVSLKLNTRREGDKLYLTPELESIQVPLGKGQQLRIDGLNTAQAGKFNIDSSGHLQVTFDSLHFSGSSDAHGPKAANQGKADTAQLEIAGKVYQDKRSEISAQGRISLDLDSQDTQQISFGGENLGKRVTSARLEAQIDSDIAIDAKGNVQAESRNHWRIEDAQIQGRRYDIVSDQIDVSLDTQSGLKLEVRTASRPVPPYTPPLSQNVVESVIGGPNYNSEMLKAIAGARESIEQETFLMYAGDKTQVLMRALALKAAGLKEEKGQLVRDALAPKGIPVRVLFNNNKLNHEGALPTIRQFEATVTALAAEIAALKLPDKAKAAYTQQLKTQLAWGSLERGVAKADHRKLLVIDGKTAYTGGINMGNHFLQQDSYHDIMLKLNGPAVREMQGAFIENWKDFTGQERSDWNTKSVSELGKHRDNYARQHKLQATGVAVATTDESKTEIEAAYLHAIEKATGSISVEQAYYFYPPVQAALKRALARGVTIDLIVPKRSDEELFDIINLAQIRDLMETQQKLGKGQVNAWLYTGDPGKYAHTVHTKALSSDGLRAVVGSANLLPRSLRSPFQEDMPDGSKRHVLFNEEMSLYLEGDAAEKLQQQLFEKDKAKAQKIDFKAVQEQIRLLGGESALQTALIKAQLA